MATITTIIPSYNAAPFIAETLRSAFAQSRRPDQVMVVDDCSTDETVEIARSFPVTLLSTESNSGHATARNIGIRATSHDYIAWLDADDIWEPEHLEVVCGLLDRYPEAGVACSSVRKFGTRCETWTPDIACEQPVDAFWPSVRYTQVPAMTAVTRRAPLTAVGGFDASIRVAPDFDLWLRLSRHTPFVATRQVTCNYRWHDGQISMNTDRQQLSLYQTRYRYWKNAISQESIEFLDRYARLVLELWLSELTQAWGGRDFHRFRTLLSWSQYVPGFDGQQYVQQLWESELDEAWYDRDFEKISHLMDRGQLNPGCTRIVNDLWQYELTEAWCGRDFRRFTTLLSRAQCVPRSDGQQLAQQLWESELDEAWYHRDFAKFGDLMAWGKFIPGSNSQRFRRWRMRSRVPRWLVKAADRVRRASKLLKYG